MAVQVCTSRACRISVGSVLAAALVAAALWLALVSLPGMVAPTGISGREAASRLPEAGVAPLGIEDLQVQALEPGIVFPFSLGDLELGAVPEAVSLLPEAGIAPLGIEDLQVQALEIGIVFPFTLGDLELGTGEAVLPAAGEVLPPSGAELIAPLEALPSSLYISQPWE